MIDTQNQNNGNAKMQGDAHSEGTLTKKLENVTSVMPSGMWLGIGLGAMAGSIVLKLTGFGKTANFVGQWVPTILILGLYNKLVKVAGNDQASGRSTPFATK